MKGASIRQTVSHRVFNEFLTWQGIEGKCPSGSAIITSGRIHKHQHTALSLVLCDQFAGFHKVWPDFLEVPHKWHGGWVRGRRIQTLHLSPQWGDINGLERLQQLLQIVYITSLGCIARPRSRLLGKGSLGHNCAIILQYRSAVLVIESFRLTRYGPIPSSFQTRSWVHLIFLLTDL